jgi:hypothetical protein
MAIKYTPGAILSPFWFLKSHFKYFSFISSLNSKILKLFTTSPLTLYILASSSVTLKRIFAILNPLELIKDTGLALKQYLLLLELEALVAAT